MRKPLNPSSEICLSGLEGYLSEFLNDRLVELNKVKDALNDSDYFMITEIAHKWRGIAAPYGFGILGEIADELEASAEGKSHAACLLLINEAHEYLFINKKKAAHS